MANRSLTVAALIAAGLLTAVSLLAERPFSSTYDNGRRVSLKGVVTRIDWANPRAFLFVDVRDASGEVANWAVEFGNPIELERAGWKRSSLHIGDVVSVEGVPAAGDIKQAFAHSVVLASSGKRLFVTVPKVHATSHLPAPRWPDGQVRLGPAPGKKGYWAGTSHSLVESGVGRIPMNADGLLMNISDAARVAPFLPWARAVYEYRQRTRLKDDPLARCVPPGGPRQFETPNGFQFVEQRDLGRILLLLGGGDRNWRVIYTDGRPQGQPDEVVRSYYGNSVGHWEEGSLVVDSIGFNERFWFDKGGLPHTEGLHLVERFTRPDLNTLKYEVTVDDPRTYSRPWKGGWTMEWVPDEEIQEYFCEENAESTFVR